MRPGVADPGPPPEGFVVAQRTTVVRVRGAACEQRVEPPPTALGIAYLFVLGSLWVLNLADLLVTIHWTGSVGWAAEGNLLMRKIALLFGSVGFAVYKVFLMTLVVLVLWWLFLKFEAEAVVARERWRLRAFDGMRWAAFAATLGLLSFYVWVVWNNLLISGLL